MALGIFAKPIPGRCCDRVDGFGTCGALSYFNIGCMLVVDLHLSLTSSASVHLSRLDVLRSLFDDISPYNSITSNFSRHPELGQAEQRGPPNFVAAKRAIRAQGY
jgi:hypothetical protein